MCDVLTRCRRPTYDGRSVHQTSYSSRSHLPHILLCVQDAQPGRSSLLPTDQQDEQVMIQPAPTFPPLFSTWKPVSCSLDSRLPDFKQFHRTSYTKIPQGLTTLSSPVDDRWMRSILTRSPTLALFCQLRAGMHARPANATAHQPPHHARCTQPRLLTCLSRGRTAKHFPIASARCRHCASWLTLIVTIGSPLQG